MSKPHAKKSETIEVRLSHELKSDLAGLSQSAGRSMSDVVRGLIEGEVRGSTHPTLTHGETSMTHPTSTRWLRAALIAAPVAALSALYLFSAQAPVYASPEFRITFAELDRDGDDRVTQAEVASFLAMDGWEPEPACADGSAEPGEPCTIEAAAAEHIDRADGNADGLVTFAELEAILLRERAEEFLHFDVNEDGFVTSDELVGLMLRWMIEDEPEMLAEEGISLSDACRAGVEAEAFEGIAALCGQEDMGRIELAHFDADRNGRVTLQEFLSH